MSQLDQTIVFPPAPPSHEDEVTSLTTVESTSDSTSDSTSYVRSIPICLKNLPPNIEYSEE